ncbi:hypothetical protein H6G33_08900 [Calothrix sp. FACHB-1219]|uniref:hypothetical protein n=1 Tax=unclassified Calothrix TaxID=2619626 RepID=UPI00168295AA|nr:MULTISPECIES: hypothetical protein [unclassified Calothrix]MBD2202114.1 hypothetical protein [Calothrix sp. FACHB-168]MBD2217148.1 hypothetical protein [Calothrix sp. FACHB-1219]
MNVNTEWLLEMNMEIKKNHLTTAHQNRKIADLLDNLTEQELELVVGGTNISAISKTVENSLETTKLEKNEKCWGSSGGGSSGGSGGGGSGGSGGW